MFFEKEKLKKTITITITQSCNLNCCYCYEDHKSKNFIDTSVAYHIIDRELSCLSKDDEIEIDLFGGEPFVKFDTIKAIADYIDTKYNKHNITLFITTNGTLLDDDSKKWCKDHCKKVKLGLSFDGTPQMQDINRSNSSQLIDLDFFAETYPDQEVKMTISQATLPFLSEGVIFLHNKGFKVSCNLAYGLDWSEVSNKDILERELMKLINFYLEHKEISPCSILDSPISPIAYAEKVALRTCGAGWTMVAYDTNGQPYPCQFFMPLSIGVEKANAVKDIEFHNDVIPDNILDPKCVDCILKSVCQRCYGSNYLATGNLYIQDENMCSLTKIIYSARAYFKAQLLEQGCYSECSDDEIKTLAKSILLIQENL